MGIAASLAASVRQNFGTMAKPLHAGNAARNGVVAAKSKLRGRNVSGGGATRKKIPVSYTGLNLVKEKHSSLDKREGGNMVLCLNFFRWAEK